MSRVVVGMSSGVDSSVAAAILKDQGYQVIGVTMQVWPSDESAGELDGAGGCCGINETSDAQMVAQQLKIPHYVMDFRDVFTKKVIADFCREYARGRTPNPCIRCNQHIKFGTLLDQARGLGADFLATGHYARIEKADGRYTLKKGGDSAKDQSYVLYTMTQDRLEHTLMPLGPLTKKRVRQIARDLGLTVAEKSESQEICFIPDNDYSKFVEEYVPQVSKTGPVMNRKGNILGEHGGIIHYTIGQRRGLGIPAKARLYVIAIDPKRNAVIVGSKDEIYSNALVASDVNWIASDKPEQPVTVEARIRYLHNGAKASVIPLTDGRVRVEFEQPQMAITPGQAVVFYQDETVVGGGTIEETLST
jgi:tRNA-uridine 2-sulfurtransferase